VRGVVKKKENSIRIPPVTSQGLVLVGFKDSGRNLGLQNNFSQPEPQTILIPFFLKLLPLWVTIPKQNEIK